MNIEKEFEKLLIKLDHIQKAPYLKIRETIELQEKLLKSIIKIEEKILKNKARIVSNKQKIKESDSKEFKIKKSNENNAIKEEIEFLKKELKRFREIGDSIAFLYFDKRDLKSLCWKQDAGYLSGKNGLKKELEVFYDYASKGMICILNDITNSLRFGDITICIDGKPKLIEVKTNKYDNPRVNRQAANLAERNNLLENDIVENFPEKNTTLIKIDAPKIKKDYLQQFQDTLYQINIGDDYFIEPEEGIWYFINYKSNKYSNFDKIRKKCKKPKVFFLNMFKNCDENYLPFPILFNNNHYLSAFYKGELLITVLIDFEVFLEKLSRYQILLESEDNLYYHFSFQNNSAREEICMSKLTFNRIGREFESIDWTISCLCKVIENVKDKKHITPAST